MNPTEWQTAAAALLAALNQSATALTPEQRAQIEALQTALAASTPLPPTAEADVITRDKIEVHDGGHYQPNWKVDKVEINSPPPDPTKERATDAESAYLRRLRRESNALPLAQDSRAAGDRDKGSRTPELVRVYVDLRVAWWPTLEQVFQRLSIPNERRSDLRSKLLIWAENIGKETVPFASIAPEGVIIERLAHWSSNRAEYAAPDDELFAHVKDTRKVDSMLEPLSALEALTANRRLVLLGDPGGGKSTFVNHLAFLCAGARLGEEAGWQASLDNLFPTPLLPLRVIVRRWSSRLKASDAAGPKLLYAALMEETGLEWDGLMERLNQPDTLVLLDGLDEAPGADPNDATALDRRRTIVESVEAFCGVRPACRVLVTCRVKPYEQKVYQLSDTPAFTLAPLDDPRIERFLGNWYGEMARTGVSSPEKAEADRAQLQAALARRPDLREMAEIPLLATMLARVNARSGLPDNRADLYHECVEQLLWEWEAAKSREGGDRAGLVDLLNAEGRFRVILTRSDDRFLTLQERSSIANKAKADLFISVHCNAALNAASNGFEIYFLSEKATDDEAAAVARRENAVIELEGLGGKARGKVEELLWALARNEHINESSTVAAHIARQADKRLGSLNRGVKQAGFYVLRGTAMPAVLVESAFITNPKEEGLLRSARYQQRIVDAVYAGLLDYEKRKIQARLAHPPPSGGGG